MSTTTKCCDCGVPLLYAIEARCEHCVRARALRQFPWPWWLYAIKGRQFKEWQS